MKIAVLISGGVDSSVALKLLKEQGHDVTAFYLKIWLEDELKYLNDCPWEEDLKFVREICERESVPLEVVPMQQEYFDTIVEYTLSEVKVGRTPNPDVMCNNNIKFGIFLKKVDDSFEKIATGHYAQIEERDGISYLKRAPDPVKDQTYFLSNLKQEQLARLMFPIGEMTKKEVRALAEKYNLPNKDRKDSQGICFLGKFKYNDFLKHYLGEKPGDIIDFDSGEKLGEHEGYWFFTVGQRKGIKLGGGPYFVVKKDIEKNTLYVSNKYFDENKKRDTLKLGDLNWNTGKAPDKKDLQVKLRHGESFYNCHIEELTTDMMKIRIDRQDQGIAPGQFTAFYDSEYCIGSGVIDYLS
ncbi:tRNA 2-thiouridine(34) synthase MnmA [Pseudomonadota bacterium]